MRRTIGMAALIPASMGIWLGAAADEGKKSQAARKPTLADIAWMVGTWEGEPDATRYCETWGRARHGAMLGMCHMVSTQGRPTYEIIAIEEVPKGLIYRIMHYGPGLKRKHDQPNEMPVIEVTKDRIVFMEQEGDNPARVSYRREGKGRMVARVEHIKNGKASGFDIPMRRAARSD